jgi:hypothetical protein
MKNIRDEKSRPWLDPSSLWSSPIDRTNGCHTYRIAFLGRAKEKPSIQSSYT